MLFSQFTRAQAQALHCARAEVVHEDVRACDQSRKNVLPRWMLDVQGEAFLGAVHPHEMRGKAVDGAVVGARRVAAVRALDLDHTRAELGELARRERPGDDLLERHDGDAVKRSHSNEIVNPGRGNPADSVCQLSPAATGGASVSTPVVMISPALSDAASGCLLRRSTK